MNKRYEVLDGLPTYGEMAIPIIGDDEIFVSEGYVVKFFKDDGSTWIANFPMGFTHHSFIKEFSKNNYLLVVAGGDGYLMNPNHTKPVIEFPFYIEEIIERDNGKLIIATLTDIIFLNEDAEIEWRKNISWDGIKNLSLDGNILNGYCYDIFLHNTDDSWVKFTIDIETKEVKGGCGNFDVVPEKPPWYRYIWVGGFLILLYYQLHR